MKASPRTPNKSSPFTATASSPSGGADQRGLSTKSAIYLPPEGSVTLVTKEDTRIAPEVVVKDHGWTFRPGGGTIYSARFLPEVDVKLVYWKRYSFLAGINSEFAGVGAARHVDDLIPFHNLEIFGLGGHSWHGTFRFGIGIRTNF